jgi:hypothetical protein
MIYYWRDVIAYSRYLIMTFPTRGNSSVYACAPVRMLLMIQMPCRAHEARFKSIKMNGHGKLAVIFYYFGRSSSSVQLEIAAIDLTL